MKPYRYEMKSTSRNSSDVSDIELWASEGGKTRKVLRSEIVRNPKASSNSVKIAIVHQRRAQSSSAWTDIGGETLSDLHAGDAAKMQLDSATTRKLFDHPSNLFEIGAEGPRMGRSVLVIADEDEVIKTDAGRARVIRKLLSGNHGDEMWQTLIEEDPSLATKMSLSRIYGERKKVLREFRSSIDEAFGENYWQNFFDEHHWMFGSSYKGRVGERRIGIQSTVDYPLITEDGHLEIVEIKTPEATFWRENTKGEPFRYRGKYLVPSRELQGALAQATHYILEIEREMDSKAWAEAHGGIYPVKPKCLVILGRSNDWTEDEWTAYRLLNDSIHGIIVLTFDHLLLRASQVLQLFNPDEG